jgi:hypothetical protein
LSHADSANNLRLKIKLAGLRVDQEPVEPEKSPSEKAKPGPLFSTGNFRLRKS